MTAATTSGTTPARESRTAITAVHPDAGRLEGRTRPTHRQGGVTITRLLGLVFLATVTLGATAGCDPGGAQLRVANQWDQEVVVVVTTSAGTAQKVVPAGTAGTLFNTFASVQDGWTVVVLDGSCRRLAEVPYEATGQTVHIGSEGQVEMQPEDWHTPAEVEYVSLLDATCP